MRLLASRVVAHPARRTFPGGFHLVDAKTMADTISNVVEPSTGVLQLQRACLGDGICIARAGAAVDGDQTCTEPGMGPKSGPGGGVLDAEHLRAAEPALGSTAQDLPPLFGKRRLSL